MLIRALIAAAAFVASANLSSAQAAWTETVLHSFSNSGPEIANGYAPWGGLIRDENGVLYGTTWSGGTGAGGVAYKLTP